jgi:hydrogenase 3 maturation protease
VGSGEGEPTVGLQEVEQTLRKWLSGAGRVVIVGIGSQLQGDDAAGARVAQQLHGRTPGNVLPMVCWTVPESYTQPIRRFRPTHVLLIDAAELGRMPGVCRLVSAEDVLGLAISTHPIPLSLLAEYLRKTTGAKTALLALQPKQIELGAGLSQELDRVTHDLADVLLRALAKCKK